MSEFKQYRRKQIAELRPVTTDDIEEFKREGAIEAYLGFNISISDADRANGSPKIGDMIARNPKDFDDQCLVAKQYFNDNFEAI